MEEKSTERHTLGHKNIAKKTQMARWSEAYTNYATAQLYSQMVTTKLNGLNQ